MRRWVSPLLFALSPHPRLWAFALALSGPQWNFSSAAMKAIYIVSSAAMTLISAEDQACTSMAAEEASPPATRPFTSLACSARHSAFTGASAKKKHFLGSIERCAVVNLKGVESGCSNDSIVWNNHNYLFDILIKNFSKEKKTHYRSSQIDGYFLIDIVVIFPITHNILISWCVKFHHQATAERECLWSYH